jgi:hypothetical protein
MADVNKLDWNDEDIYWRSNYNSRPYASGQTRDYEYYRPAYRFGYDAAGRYEGRDWNDVETELATSWGTYEHRGMSAWDEVKAAVRDAWDRVRGRRPVVTR